MRVTLDPSVYVFDPTAATVTFAAGSTRPTHQGQILSIVNTSNEIYLYLPVQSGRGGAYNATTGILTLEIGTATMSSTNALQIVVDNDATPATSALQAAGNILLSGISDKLPTLDSGRLPVSGTFWPTTQPISGSVTIDGTPSVAISGIAAVSGPLTNTELRDTAVPVSGSVTINAGTNTSTASLALETGGNLSTLVREFEMEASNSGSQNLGILSLADDNEEVASFEHLNDAVMHNTEDDLNIDFD